jgi:hypothetical protein|nr:MAG TPA: hypothetical protein [Caudoviricetes sp.]
MISKEERSIIATELWNTSLDSLYDESLQRALARITKAQNTSWRGVLRRLAQLIDPEGVDDAV